MEEYKGHRVLGEHVNEGVVYDLVYPHDLLQRVHRQFQFREDDVLLATYPKSGTTWMQEIIWLIMHNVDVDKAKEIYLNDRFPFLDQGLKNPLPIDILEASSSPRLIKTHQQFRLFADQLRSKKTKVIVGVRNIKDNLVSYYHFYRMNAALGNFKGSFAEFFELFKAKHLAFGDWFDYNLGYWNNRHDLNLFLLKYEDLHKDFGGTVRKLAEFLDKKITDAEIEKIAKHVAFDAMKNNDKVNHSWYMFINTSISPFMRKGQVRDWKNYFQPDMNECIDKVYKERLEGSGLETDYELPK